MFVMRRSGLNGGTRKFVMFLTSIAFVVVFMLSQRGVAAEVTIIADIAPSPTLTALDVVKIQLQALSHNDAFARDSGIEIAFRFASPENKKFTGPLGRFVLLLNSPAYRIMINSQSIEIGDKQIDEAVAVVPVIVKGNQGERAGFVFRLSRHDTQACAQCWMTDSVVRVELTEKQII